MRACPTPRYGLMDCARHVINCHLHQETRVRNAFDDVAFELRLMTWRGLSISPSGEAGEAVKKEPKVPLTAVG